MKTLVIVDIQNDFLPGGSLAVRDGDAILPVVNQLRGAFELVVLTQDWHPSDHGSFAANHPGKKPGDVITLDGLEQVLWPAHCVQGTKGAAFHESLLVRPTDAVFRKGTDPAIDSYSAFHDNAHRKSTGLGDFLRAKRVKRITLCGLATDYCVKFSTLDALHEGFGVDVVTAACRGVNLAPEDSARALEAMREKGARLL